MTSKNEILKYIHDLLNISAFEDHSLNGLQVEGKEQISRIILGVSPSERLFTEAVKQKADMIILHHGLFWKNDPTPFSLTGILRNRIALLIKNDINLAAYHLPLDAHAEIGNNTQILKKLNLEPIKSVDIGFLGKLAEPMTIDKFAKLVDEKLETKCLSFQFGKRQISQILVMSGSAASAYSLAIEHDADTFITGEIKETFVRAIEEVKLNLILAGHYNTEKFGVQALGDVLQAQFDVTCQFIDIPNPI